MPSKDKTLSDKTFETLNETGKNVIWIEDVKEFIKIYSNDIVDCVIIKMKDVPKHMVGIDLSWLDKEIQSIRDRLRNKLKERVGKELSE